MGAHNIDFKLRGKAKISEIEKKFEEIKELEKEENGHQGGYSGDFQTVDEIRFDFLNKGIGDFNKDYELALEKSEKWYYGQAIYTKNRNGDDITLVVAWGAC